MKLGVVILNASTAVFQPLTQVSNTAATTGLTSGFGMGPGRTLPLWPAYSVYFCSPNLSLLDKVSNSIMDRVLIFT